MNREEFIRLAEAEISSIAEEQYVKNGNGDIIFAHLETKETIIIKTKDILFIQEEKEVTFIRTLDNSYSCRFKSYDIFEYLEEKYPDFKFIDQNLMANISNIVAYDSYYNRLYFSAEISIHTVGPFIQYLKNSFVEMSDLKDNTAKARKFNHISFNEF